MDESNARNAKSLQVEAVPADADLESPGLSSRRSVLSRYCVIGAGAAGVHRGGGFLGGGDRPLRVRDQEPSCVGEDQLAVGPDEQADAEVVLQPADLLGQAGLGDEVGLRGGRKGAVLNRGPEVLPLQRDRRRHARSPFAQPSTDSPSTWSPGDGAAPLLRCAAADASALSEDVAANRTAVKTRRAAGAGSGRRPPGRVEHDVAAHLARRLCADQPWR